MANKVLIIGGDSKSELILRTMQEKYGNDIILVTTDEAKEQGLTEADFVNTPTMKITAPIINNPSIIRPEKSGKEKRRERRKAERKNKTR